MKPTRRIRPILILLVAAFALGMFTLPDYGESWDEPDIYRYAEYALDAYAFLLHPQDLKPFDTSLNLYGPAYFILVALLERPLSALLSWTAVTAHHFVYFLTFLASGYLLDRLARRWLGEWAALGAVLLFLTQPLLWGHAFMNPKDMPFMALFLAGIVFGLEMADAPRGALRAGRLCAAGIALGLATSIRILGPLAGLLTAAYTFSRHGRRAFPLLFGYGMVALAAAYLTWPYLWRAPIANYLASIELMAKYPYDAKVFFWGNMYLPDELPRLYFPTFFALQLTEPLLLLCVFGMVALFRSRQTEAILLFTGWFLFPVFMLIAADSVIYDNARQLFFLLPPVFIAAGFALEWLFAALARTRTHFGLRLVLLALIALPGVIPALRLHPYEYTYYNHFVGGTAGAVGQLETDYWSTSFKEAFEYINSVAPRNARILLISGSEDVAKRYARPDLQVVTEENDPTPKEKYQYALILTRRNQNESRCPKSDVAYVVRRSGVAFAIVTQLREKGFCK